jgi:hypothetical protein
MMASGALDLPSGRLFAALDVLIAVGTGKLELAHKPFSAGSAQDAQLSSWVQAVLLRLRDLRRNFKQSVPALLSVC